MRAIIILLVVLASEILASAQETVDVRAFGSELLQTLKSEYPDYTFERKDDWTIRYTEPGDDPTNGFINLDNAYAEYTNAPDNKDTIIAHYVTVLSAADTELIEENFRSQIVVLLRHREYGEGVADQFPDNDPPSVVKRPFVGDLAAVLFVDFPDALRAVTTKDLQEHGLKENEAFILARTNLAERIGPLSIETEMGLEIVSAESGLALGQFLLDDPCPSPELSSMALILDRNTFLMGSATKEEMDVEIDRNGAPQGLGLLMQVAPNMIYAGETFSKYAIMCLGGELTFARPSFEGSPPSPEEDNWGGEFPDPFEPR